MNTHQHLPGENADHLGLPGEAWLKTLGLNGPDARAASAGQSDLVLQSLVAVERASTWRVYVDWHNDVDGCVIPARRACSAATHRSTELEGK